MVKTVPNTPASATHRLRRSFRCVVIASSLGGPPALYALLPELCRRLTLPIIIAQHMAENFTASFAKELHRRCSAISRYEVYEAADGMRASPYRVFVAPGNYHLSVIHSILRTDCNAPKECGCRPAADVLFRTAATSYHGAVIGIILTGMGRDGTAGAQAIKERGGYIFAQNRASSAVWGMPGSVIMANLADEIHPLQNLAEAVEGMLRARATDTSLLQN